MRNFEYKPVIGIPASTMQTNWGFRHTLAETYIAAMLAAGASPVIIPSTGDAAAIYAIYRKLDGLLLSGGVDVHPRHYGEEMNGTEEVDENRDATEIMITRWALEDNLPILGICRGIQVLNVAAGGTLWQDIASQLPDVSQDHRESAMRRQRDYIAHPVNLEADSRLAALLGTTKVEANTLHHQAVKDPAQGFRVVGTAPDGIIEAMESTRHDWVFAVQCHPEDLWRDHTWANKLFNAFVAQVKERTQIAV
jgi:putative glutamine amidotransferase